MRALALSVLSHALYAAGVWVPYGTVLNSPFADAEPTVMYTTTDCQFLSNPCYQIWWTQGADIKYTESLDGIGWDLTPGLRPLLALSAHHESSVFKSNGTYYLTAPNSANTQIDLYSSSTPTGFTLLHSAILVPGTTGAWDDSHLFNTSLVIEGTIGSGGTAYILYEAKGSPNPTIFGCGTATSTDLATWTKGINNPILPLPANNCSAPDIHHINGTWYAWVTPLNTLLIHRLSSSVFDATWTDLGVATYQNNTADECNQVADPFLISIGSATMLYYSAHCPGLKDHLKMALANLSFTGLVAGSEGLAPRFGTLSTGSLNISGSGVVQ